jgi:hypothetical protein
MSICLYLKNNKMLKILRGIFSNNICKVSNFTRVALPIVNRHLWHFTHLNITTKGEFGETYYFNSKGLTKEVKSIYKKKGNGQMTG